MALACAPSSYALDWRIEPTLGASVTYTDNANHSENDPQERLILSATPGITARYEGSRRARAMLQYGMTGVTRFGENESTDLLHNLNALGNAELIEDFLFIDGSAHISQELVSLEGSLAEAEISEDNRTTVGTYSVSPYIQKRLGTFANAQARYTTGGALFGNGDVNDTRANALTAGLTSGTRFDDLSWGINYYLRNAAYDNDTPDSRFERVVASLGYALTRKFRIFGTVGEETNDYPSVTENDGSSWSAGFGWSPTRRTSLEASVGERFFGNTYNLSASHYTRASNWTVSYVEDLSDLNQFVSSAGTVYNYRCPGPGGLVDYDDWPFSVPPAPDCIAFGGTPGLVFDLRNGVFISKVLRAGVSWGIGKLSYSLNAFDSRRDFQQVVNAEDRTQGVTATLSYQLAPKTSATGSLGLNRNTIPATLSETGADREDDIYKLTLGVDHQFDPDLSGALVYQHQQRDSNVANGDFTENRITGRVHMSF